MLRDIGHWLLYWTGIGNESGKGYALWSGIGSDLTYLAALGVIMRKLNCHTKGCFRLGHHHLADTPYVLCRKHHPGIANKAPSPSEIQAAHRKAKAGR